MIGSERITYTKEDGWRLWHLVVAEEVPQQLDVCLSEEGALHRDRLCDADKPALCPAADVAEVLETRERLDIVQLIAAGHAPALLDPDVEEGPKTGALAAERDVLPVCAPAEFIARADAHCIAMTQFVTKRNADVRIGGKIVT